MDIHVTFPGNKRVTAKVGPHVIHTDQSVAHGGEGGAPEPFDLFLTSLATCAGLYVLGFCQARTIPTQGLGIVQHHRFDDATGRLSLVQLEIVLPSDFPEKYRAAIVRAAEGCKVRKVLASPPEVAVIATSTEREALAQQG
jgi:ribosomal protein S12 methylthiotransferase accessory factor